MKDKIEIRLQNIYDCSTKENMIELVDVHSLPLYWDDDYKDTGEFIYYTPTLKDIAILLYRFVGGGVIDQLVEEISNKTGCELKILHKSMLEIIEEYSEVSDEEAIKRWKEMVERHDKKWKLVS